MVTMVTQCWGQVIIAVHACVPVALTAGGSLLKAVTEVTTPRMPSASAILDTKVNKI